MKQLKILYFFLTLMFITPTHGQGVYVSDKNSAYAKKHEANNISYLIPSKDGTELELVMRDGSVISLPRQSTFCLFFYQKDITIDEFSVSNITDSSVEFQISYSGLNKIQNRFLVISKSHIDKSTLPNTLHYFSEKDHMVKVENLESSSTYYAICAIVNSLSNDTIFSKELCFSTKRATVGSINGHGYVDLGLPSGTLWASCNVGASTETSKGNYYAWGETFVQTASLFYKPYEWGNYKYANGSSMTSIGSDIGGKSSYDAATKNWGAPWRMPSKAQIEELVNYCNAYWTTIDGCEGMYVEGPNGNHIFLPGSGTGRYPDTTYASFWSSQSCDLYHAYSLYIQKSPKWFCLQWNTSLNAAGNERCNGYNVRPVAIQ